MTTQSEREWAEVERLRPQEETHRRMVLIGARPELSDAEHLALALEFFDPRCGEEYLSEHAPELLGEFERLSEGGGA